MYCKVCTDHRNETLAVGYWFLAHAGNNKVTPQCYTKKSDVTVTTFQVPQAPTLK